MAKVNKRRAHNEATEQWLREEVLAVCDAMDADPLRAIPSQQVFAAVRARHEGWLNKNLQKLISKDKN